MSYFTDKLAELAPKRKETPASLAHTIYFEQSPVRAHAASFAAFLRDTPGDQREFTNALWVFGEMLCGDMEKRMNYAFSVAQDAINVAATPSPTISAREA